MEQEEQRLVKIKLAPLGRRVPKELVSGINKRIGSKIQKGTTSNLMGLNAVEREHLLPFIIKIQPSHPEWEQRVKDFYSNLVITPDPENGIELNASCRYKIIKINGEDVKIPIPENHIDYIKYRQCLVDNTVGENLDQAKGEGIPFYIEDVLREKSEKADLESIIDKVEKVFLKLSDTKENGEFKLEEEVNSVIRSLGSNPLILDNLDKTDLMRKAKMRDIEYIRSNKDTKEARFYNTVSDPNLKNKGMLLSFLGAGIITQKGDYIMDDDGNVMGATMGHAILWIKDPVNSSKVMSYKQRLEEKNKTAVA